jgi:hypothetical protein
MINNKHAHNWIDRTGEIGYTKYGTPMKIVEYNRTSDILIEFLDNYRIQKHTSYEKFINRNVKNPYDRSLYGIGFLGEGGLAVQNNKKTKEYRAWSSMIYRCYYKKYKYTFAAYKDCEVSEEWENYSNFYKWYSQNKYKCSDNLEIDKDILSNGNKVYSSETCLLVPKRINNFCQASKQGGCYLTKSNTWAARLNHNKQNIHIGVFKSFKEAEDAFLLYKNSILQNLVEKYKTEIPKDTYNKLKNAKLRG